MTSSGSLNQKWRRNASVRFAVFSPDGKSIAAGSDDGTIAIIESETGQDIHEMTGYENGSAPSPVFRGVFSHDGRYLATVGYDSIVRVWDVSTGKQLFKIVEKTEDANFINFRQDQLTAQTGTNAQRLVNDIGFSPNDKYIIVARGDSRSVHVFSWSYFEDPGELLNRAQKILNK
jgi:dipeptidyl aminopeptidase/acylaminoacyl peptidase